MTKMSTTWLSSVLHLLTFFRCTLIWVDVNLLAFSILSGWWLGVGILALSAVACIFNITVCVLEFKAKKRARQLGSAPVPPPPKISVIVLDFVFAALFIAAFVLDLLSEGVYHGIYGIGYGYGFSVFGAQTYIGVLVAWHYHLFFAAVCVHSRRRHRSSALARESTEIRMNQGMELEGVAQSEIAAERVKG